MLRWKLIQAELRILDADRLRLQAELNTLQSLCAHPTLPVRDTVEEFRDTCLDCGFVSYCYKI